MEAQDKRKETENQKIGTSSAMDRSNRRSHWEILMGTSSGPSEMGKDGVIIESTVCVNTGEEGDLGGGIVTCEDCNISFSGRSKVSNLNKHIGASHLQKRPHVCDMCSKAFQYAYKLKKHTDSVHRGLKPFKCPDCNKFFSDRSNTTKHIRNRSCLRRVDNKTWRWRGPLCLFDYASMRIWCGGK